MQKDSDKIGFIGLGIMGSPMAANLITAGHKLVVYNRTVSKAEPFRSMGGAEVAASPAEVGSKCRVTLSVITDAPDLEQVLTGPNGYLQGAKKGDVFVDMGTNSPANARKFSSLLSERGIDFLDAPVTGGQKGAQEGTLTIMVGGGEKVFERVRPVFEHMGRKVVHGGPTGSGQLLKMCNQIVVALDMLASTEALMVARKAGVPDTKLFEVLSSGAANSFTVQNLLPRMMKGDFEPGFRAAHLKKDLSYATSLTKELGIPSFGASLALQLYTALVSMGMGENGTQSLKKLYDMLSQQA